MAQLVQVPFSKQHYLPSLLLEHDIFMSGVNFKVMLFICLQVCGKFILVSFGIKRI